jgi:hypothetical protein
MAFSQDIQQDMKQALNSAKTIRAFVLALTPEMVLKLPEQNE